MAEMYDDVPEIGAEAAAIEKRRKIAEMMMAQGMTPLEVNQMAGGYVVPVSMTHGLAQLAKAYIGKKGLDAEEKAAAGLSGKRDAIVQAELEKIRQIGAGTPGQAEIPMPADELGGGPGRPEIAATPANPRAAIEAALMSRAAPVQRYGSMLMKEEESADARRENAANRKFELEQRGKDKLAEIQAAAEQGRITKAEADARSADLRRELQANQLTSAKELRSMALAMRPEPAVTVTEVMKDGKPVKIDARTGRLIGDAPAGGSGKPMSATAQKELIQTDEEIQGSKSAIGTLKQALELNDKAMGFTGASTLSSLGTLLPEGIRPEAIDATQNLDNIVTSSALPQLKSIFGGMPTEGERKILLDIQGSSSKPPKVRKEIFGRAIEAAEKRVKFAQEKSKALREGKYFSGDGGISEPTESKKSAPSSSFADADKERRYQEWKKKQGM